ncbi:MAG TPA: non-canonical purine NTP pyrophosphatase [Candidatus Angelobacter sp.]|nr:non-canonical purine NTP pyrophosphatase [Candidatus Angelobacter sp.]
MAEVRRIYLATSNPGKVREFQEAAQSLGLTMAPLPALTSLPLPVEDGLTFEENARKKAEYYSRHAAGELVLPSQIAQERRDPGALVLAEDSGLSVDALSGAPGVYSARYAAVLRSGMATHENSGDQENNLALVHELERLGDGKFAAKYVSVIALARDGRTLATFTGEAHGEIVTVPRGTGGFGYDPLFYFPALGKTFAELPLEEKRKHSHRGQAFRKVLEWWGQNHESLRVET